MKKSLLALAVAWPALMPMAAEARPVRITATLKSYGGDGAYLAIYLTDKAGKLVKTIHVAGGKAKYHAHLSAWHRQSGGRIDGTTGASVGAGKSLRVTTEIAEALLEAGFEVRVDAAAEDMADAPVDARIGVSADNAGKPVSGRRYVQSLQIDM